MNAYTVPLHNRAITWSVIYVATAQFINHTEAQSLITPRENMTQ